MTDQTPLTDQQLDDLHQQLTGPLGSAADVCGGTALRLVDEVRRLSAALAREQRLHGDTIDDRDRATDMADKLAYAVAPEEVIGEHTADNSPWQNALELVTSAAEVTKLRAEVAAARRQAVAWAADVVDEKLSAEPDHNRASALYELLLQLRGELSCTCARSQGLHERTCRKYVPGHELLSPVLALAAYRSERVVGETHVVADDSDDPEHVDDCPGCTTA